MEEMKKFEYRSFDSENAEYLKSGKQTELTEAVVRTAHAIEGGFEEKISTILDIVSKLPMVSENKNVVFRKRTADQILSDNYVTGCTDSALVCVALFRAIGIPAKYVETVDVDWVLHGGEQIVGHVYVSVFDGLQWRVIDPVKKIVGADITQDGRVVYREGLDSWDIGIDSFDSLSKIFNDFRVEVQ